jgi:hypothetical protein
MVMLCESCRQKTVMEWFEIDNKRKHLFVFVCVCVCVRARARVRVQTCPPTSVNLFSVH